MPKKNICIHGHFYQPPRENPWLEFLEVQDTAYPSHDWNERIYNECYAPNSTARILDANGNILKLVNNYEFMSFNFGPTLLDWIQKFHTSTYEKILEADNKSLKRLGHGNAIAQVYNHIIMPLAPDSYKIDQIIWGIKDFERHFKRKPEGMWLSETAVDLKTLMFLEEYGIEFTILSPFQASCYREISKDNEKNPTKWCDVNNGLIDPRKPYQITLPNGKIFTIFFYDGRLSKAIAFEEILSSGNNFINGLKSGFSHNQEPELVNLATDGESYGHHRKFGDLTLAFAFEEIMKKNEFEITNYATYLEKYPPKYEVKIIENSSWSCAHGIERWRSNCGCSTGGGPGWNQEWRKPLRDALDYLRETSDNLYYDRMSEYTQEKDQIFHHYFNLIHNQYDIKEHFIKEYLDNETKQHQNFFKLLEIRRNCNLMYTSCGWFFNEISGIETIQILNYAERVIQLLLDFDIDIKERFLDILEKAKSNIPEYKNGREIYRLFVAKNRVTLKRVGIDFAITSLFNDYPDEKTIYTYKVECSDVIKEIKGNTTLAFGHIKVNSQRTDESQSFQFVVLHFGEIDLHASIENYGSKEDYQTKKEKILNTFRNEHLTEIIQMLTSEFGKDYYSLKDIFNEEKRAILDYITKAEIERLNQLIFYISQKNKNILDYCFKEHIPVPKPIMILNEYTYLKIIEHLFSGNVAEKDIYNQVKQVLLLSKALGFKLDLTNEMNQITDFLKKCSERYLNSPSSINYLTDFILVLKSAFLLPLNLNIWSIQNKWANFFTSQEKKLIKELKDTKIPELLSEVKDLLKIKIS